MRSALAALALLALAATAGADESKIAPKPKGDPGRPLVKQRIEIGKMPQGMKGEKLQDKLDAVGQRGREQGGGGGSLAALRASIEALPAEVKEAAAGAEKSLECSYYGQGSCEEKDSECRVCCSPDGGAERCACQSC